jgi:hypothetical protein
MKWFKNLFFFFRNRSKLNSLKADGLTLDNLKEIARINEKYIEVKLPDGAYIRIWPYGDKLKEQENQRSNFW